MSERDIDTSSENVLTDWARKADQDGSEDALDEELVEDALEEDGGAPAWGTAGSSDDVAEAASDEDLAELPAASASPVPAEEPPAEESGGDDPSELAVAEPGGQQDGQPFPRELSHEHAAGDLHIPDGYAVLEGGPDGGRRAVGVVVSRFNGDVTSRLLERALAELTDAGVRHEAISIMVVPGAFELPLAATALAKTRRFACIVALGCVIRGDTPHFDYVASEAASGLQLAALETGVPVSFGVLTLDRVEQADPRIEKGAEAVRSALEMADLFAQLRAAASH